MVILGLLLIGLGCLAILGAFFATDQGTIGMLGMDLTALQLFLFGVAAGVCILWGFSLTKWGTKRGLRQRRERREMAELSEKLDKAEAERREDRSDE